MSIYNIYIYIYIILYIYIHMHVCMHGFVKHCKVKLM